VARAGSPSRCGGWVTVIPGNRYLGTLAISDGLREVVRSTSRHKAISRALKHFTLEAVAVTQHSIFKPTSSNTRFKDSERRL